MQGASSIRSMNETPQSATPTVPLIGEPILPPLSGEVPPQGAERFSLFLGLHGRLNSYQYNFTLLTAMLLRVKDRNEAGGFFSPLYP
jgi:hypothetical protein